jgi:nucleoside 2-deoxyribosyltransferase
MTKLYLAGPMTGIEDFNRPAFFAAEEALRAAGFEVLNPARHQQGGRSWEDYMRLDLVDVLKADGLAVLSGWEASKGASLEVHVALTLGVPVMQINVWVSEAAA